MGRFFANLQIRKNVNKTQSVFLKSFTAAMKKLGYVKAEADESELSYVAAFSSSKQWVTLCAEDYVSNAEKVNTDAQKIAANLKTFCISNTVIDSDVALLDMYVGQEERADRVIIGYGEAYGLADFKAVDVLYAPEGEGLVTELNPGVYLVDANGIVVDYATIDKIAEVGDHTLKIAAGVTAKFRVANFTAANINLYGYNNVVLKDAAGYEFSNDGTGVKTVTFKGYIVDEVNDDGDVLSYVTTTKSNKNLTEYIGGETVKVLIGANKLTTWSKNGGSWASNTIRGIIIDDLLA